MALGLAGLVLGAGVVVSRFAPPARAPMASPSVEPPLPPLPTLVEKLGPGATVGTGRVGQVRYVEGDSFRFELTAGQKQLSVDVLRREDGGPAPIAQTEHLSLYFVGATNTQTLAEDEQLIRALAQQLALAEAGGAPLPRLRALSER